MCDAIDPDSNIHKKIFVDSLYYTESEFKEHFEFKQKGSSNCSLVRINCRSKARNFDKLNDSVKGLDFPFDVIAVSETWLVVYRQVINTIFRMPIYPMLNQCQ